MLQVESAKNKGDFSMGKLFELQTTKRVFDMASANELLPLVFRITESASASVQDMVNMIDRVKDVDSLMVKDLEVKINDAVTRWQSKLEKLGVEPKGMWVADFDTGDGYFCWKYPEIEIRFWHGYKDGFSGRVPIQKRLVEETKNSISPN